MSNKKYDPSISIMDQVKTYEDSRTIRGLQPLTIDNFSHEEEPVRAFGHHKVESICKALSIGADGKLHEQDWNKTSERKWLPLFDMRDKEGDAPGSGFSLGDVFYGDDSTFLGARLHVPTEELANYAGTQFLPEYREWIKGL